MNVLWMLTVMTLSTVTATTPAKWDVGMIRAVKETI